MELVVEREPNELDMYVCRFVQIVSKYTDYVVVSGYVAILLGMRRPTFDVDVLAKPMEKTRFKEMLQELNRNRFRTVEDVEKAYTIFEMATLFRSIPQTCGTSILSSQRTVGGLSPFSIQLSQKLERTVQ